MSRKNLILFAVTAALLTARFAVGQGQPGDHSPDQPATGSGRLGGGYRDAKWGMSVPEVKKRLPGRLEYETRQQNADKTLILDLGSGRKVTCYFDHDQFYQAIYQPVVADNDQQAVEAVLGGLNQKYGPGKEEEGYTDKDGKPLKFFAWNDGITKIEFRMRDPKPAEKSSESKFKTYPSSTLLVIYTDIATNARREQRQEDERKRLEEKKLRQKVKDIQNDL